MEKYRTFNSGPVSPEFYKRVKVFAALNDTTISGLIKTLLERELKNGNGTEVRNEVPNFNDKI